MNKNQEDIVNMFNQIAKTYDLANRILSFGIDKLWRSKACNMVFSFYNKQHINTIVDVACGTGDLMIDWKNIAENNNIALDKIIGIDPSVEMMSVGKTKIQDGIFLEAGAENLPLEDESTDIISISYGIRNVVKRQDALEEFARVLKPNGILVILEFTKNDKNDLASKITNFYMHRVMPVIGGLISGNSEAYMYLPASIDSFITTKEMISELKSAGLEPIFTKGYSFDMSTTFIARKI